MWFYSLIAVYPRWRGEHIEGEALDDVTVGLSPLARGTQSPCHRLQSLTRFIPAGAGNTSSHNWKKCSISVYPRWRGEHQRSPAEFQADRGLSPLARGTPTLDLIANLCGRFIPAGAGNTEPAYGCIAVFTVYPRWRGEHHPCPFGAVGDRGLSPLARGTLNERLHDAAPQRFIPAGAGNTLKIYYCFIIAF